MELWISLGVEFSWDRLAFFGLLEADRVCLRGKGFKAKSSSESEATTLRDLACSRGITPSSYKGDYLAGSRRVEPVMSIVSYADVFQISQHTL